MATRVLFLSIMRYAGTRDRYPYPCRGAAVHAISLRGRMFAAPQSLRSVSNAATASATTIFGEFSSARSP